MTADEIVLDDLNMEELLKESSAESRVGAVVTAHVVDETSGGLLVDVGLKVEGFIPMAEFRARAHPPARGESFPAVIKRMDGPDGHPLVSWREARERQYWDKVVKAKETSAPLEGKVIRQVKGGLIVDVGLEGFLPASQVDRRPVKDLSSFVGQAVTVTVLEMDAAKGNVVLSRRRILEREAAVLREETLKELAPGKIYRGRVTSLTSFGAFVDIGGIEGLLRVADVAWGRVENLSAALTVGQELDVKVLKYDPATHKIALGRKQLLTPPWKGAAARYPAGSRVKGKVTSLTSFGAFLELEPGVEGLIHQSEFSWEDRWAKPESFVQAGREAEAVVLSCDEANEKLALSFKRAAKNPWAEAAALFPVGTRVKGTVTHMTAFGAFVRLSNGIEGLLRAADISWTKPVHHPKEHVSEGQELELTVLEVDAGSERIALGLKQMHPDPFEQYKPGQAVEGRVVRFSDFGAFVELEPDVEAFLHVGEITSESRPEKPADVLALDQAVSAVVVKLQRKSKRIDISMKQLEQKQEKELLKKYRGGSTRVTLGDVVQWGGESAGEEPAS
ncbi:MAG: 30S ribosomal protein S1 [Elusimicrobiota bacterium]